MHIGDMTNPYLTAFREGAALDPATLRDLGSRFQVYAIFIIPRSGSTWLTELARNTGLLGCPQEWLNFEFCRADEANLGCPPPSHFGTFEINAYMNAVLEFSASPNGVAGIELSWPQIQCLEESAGSTIDFSFLSASFYLRRKHVLAQAVSLYRSSMSGYFHSYQSDAGLLAKFEGAAYNAHEIASMLQHLVDCEVGLEQMFTSSGLSPVRLSYEDLLPAPGQVLNTMAKALNVDKEIGVQEYTLKKISDSRNKEWTERFLTEHSEFVAAQLARRPA
jgi:LPS sulfotransferase NodH